MGSGGRPAVRDPRRRVAGGTWHIADPANPDRPAHAVRYPAAGTANAVVSGAVLGLDGSRVDVVWEAESPYLASVHWSGGGDPVLAIGDRAQKRLSFALLDADSGMVTLHSEEKDPIWVDIFPGVPCWIDGGDDGDRRTAPAWSRSARATAPTGSCWTANR